MAIPPLYPAKIRQATTGDLDALVALLRLLFSIEEDFSFDGEKQKHGLKQLLHSAQAKVFVADLGGEVVGMCTGQIVISTAEGGPAVLVEDVVVAKSHQRCGIGKQLMHALQDWAMDRGASRLQLLADRNNGPALSFYEKIGWSGTELICLRRKR